MSCVSCSRHHYFRDCTETCRKCDCRISGALGMGPPCNCKVPDFRALLPNEAMFAQQRAKKEEA